MEAQTSNQRSFRDLQPLEGGRALRFDLVGQDVAVANALRRTVLAEIRTVATAYDSHKGAASDVHFVTNTSSLHNEFLSHRLSLLPLCLTREQIAAYRPGDLRLGLRVKNSGAEMLDVTTHDVRVLHGAGSCQGLRREDVLPHDPPILITRLKPSPLAPERGEEVEVEFGARHGTARDHARWAAVSLCTYFNKLDEAQVREARARVPGDRQNQFDAIDSRRLFLKNEHGEPCAFTFTVESECRLTPAEIVDMGLEALISRARGALAPGRCDVAAASAACPMHVVTLHGQDHTLGNLLQVHMHNALVRGEAGARVRMVGYAQPHPLHDDVVLKLALADGVEPADAEAHVRALLEEAAAGLAQHLEGLRREWREATAA